MTASARPYLLSETSWKTVREVAYDVAVLPWGATEAHNYHLPYGTDNVQCERLATEAARLAWDRGAGIVVLPTIPFGVNTGQADIRLCVNMNPSTQALVLRDVVASLEGQGVPRLVLFNGHGGNDFRQMIRELQPRTKVFLCTLNWWQVLDPRAYFADLGDHAGELETSVMLHLVPDAVLPLAEAGEGQAKTPRIQAFREGWAWTPRQWTQVTADTGIGNPAAATAEKGAAYVAALAARIGEFFVELAQLDPANMYE